MDDPATMVTWETVSTGLAKAKARAFDAAVDDTRVWIEHWPGLIPAITKSAIAFRVMVTEEPTVLAGRTAGAISIVIGITDQMAVSPAGILRRYLIDAVLNGLEATADIEPKDTPVEVYLDDQQPDPTDPENSTDTLATEIAFLQDDEVLVLQYLAPAENYRSQFSHTDDRFIDHIRSLTSGTLLETSATPNNVIWTMSTE